MYDQGSSHCSFVLCCCVASLKHISLQNEPLSKCCSLQGLYSNSFWRPALSPQNVIIHVHDQASSMVYHSQQDTANCTFACGLPVLPLRASSGLQAVDARDVVDETIYTYRANVLFRNFEVKGPADKLLIYLTLFVCQCLRRTCF